MLQVNKQLHESEHQLATVALGSSNTQAPPSSSAQAPPGLTIQSGTPVAFLSTGTSPTSGGSEYGGSEDEKSSAKMPSPAMPKQVAAMEQVQKVIQEKLYKLEAIQKQLHDKKQKKRRRKKGICRNRGANMRRRRRRSSR